MTKSSKRISSRIFKLSFSIPGFIDFVKFDLSGKTTYQLRENFFNTEKYEEEKGVGMEHILQGLVTQRSRKRDRFVSEELTNHLFAAKGHNHGTDLVARYDSF